MKPDKDLTVERRGRTLRLEYRGDCPECGKSIVLADSVIRRIQRAAFEKGARAQRRDDLTYLKLASLNEECGEKTRGELSVVYVALLDAPLVEFEEKGDSHNA